MVQLVSPQPDGSVLERSAGTGQILRAILRAQPACRRMSVEINAELVKALRRIDPEGDVMHADFLEWVPAYRFDCILMNPPFERGADIVHIRRALSMLKPDGRMAAICAAGPRQAEQLVPLVQERGGT